MAEKSANEFLMYKGMPFVRNGNTIYYGNLSDDYYLLIKLLSAKDEGGIKVSDRVMVHLIKNDPTLKPNDRIVHRVERDDLHSAMVIGVSWLEQALSAEG